jgi:hypothetical protein
LVKLSLSREVLPRAWTLCIGVSTAITPARLPTSRPAAYPTERVAIIPHLRRAPPDPRDELNFR